MCRNLKRDVEQDREGQEQRNPSPYLFHHFIPASSLDDSHQTLQTLQHLQYSAEGFNVIYFHCFVLQAVRWHD